MATTPGWGFKVRHLRLALQQQAAAHGFTLRQTGPEQMPQILFEDDPDFRLGFAWGEEACARGVYLHPWHNMFICGALTEGDIRETLANTDEAFAAVKKRRAYLEASMDDFKILEGEPGEEDLSGNRLPLAPKFSFSTRATYSVSLDDMGSLPSSRWPVSRRITSGNRAALSRAHHAGKFADERLC